MAKATRKKTVVRRRSGKNGGVLRQELKQDIWAIALMSIGVFVAFCLWQYPLHGSEGVLGALGEWVYRTSRAIFGRGQWLLVFILLILGGSRWFAKIPFKPLVLGAYSMLMLAVLAMLHLLLPESSRTIQAGWLGQGGGAIGGALVQGSQYLVGALGSWLFFAVLSLVSLLIISNRTLKELLGPASGKAKSVAQNAQLELEDMVSRHQERRELRAQEKQKSIMHSLQVPTETLLKEDLGGKTQAEIRTREFGETHGPETLMFHEGQPRMNHEGDSRGKPVEKGPVKDSELFVTPPSDVSTHYTLPPLSLLRTAPKIKSQRLNKDITDNVRTLEDTLASFGVKAVVTQVNRGPSITRYELQPSPGVKVSRIVNLADDLALALAASHVRIEAPIPGKAAVGIEVPNSERTPVSLREILEDPVFLQEQSKLSFALGKDIAGAPVIADLAKMPHLLIAGSTGSGKSVCMNALIASILFSTYPEEVKLMMVDPKMVELSNYNGIPHLIHPVVTDPKKAASALRWAVQEMEKRYEIFSLAGVKDITRYNGAILEMPEEQRPPRMPQIIILIDELADLMMVAPADVEDAICRLAQMARAAGMHLVVATQRPSVDVITGIIKANIPSRIAFAVSSQTDSRTILDMGGAERLLGRGDMLFYPTGQPKPKRVQGVFVSDQEIESLTEYLKNSSNPPQYIEDLVVEENGTGPDDGSFDDLLPEAARLFIETGQASISLLQRRLRVGYTRAARIIDQMEEMGIVGGYEGSKARSILMTLQQYEERFGSQGEELK